MVTHQLYCLTVGDRAGSQLGWKQRSSIRAADGKASSYLALQATMHMLGTPCKCMATWELHQTAPRQDRQGKCWLLQQSCSQLLLAIDPPGVALSTWGLVGLFVLLVFHLLRCCSRLGAGWENSAQQSCSRLAETWTAEPRRRKTRKSTSQQHTNDLHAKGLPSFVLQRCVVSAKLDSLSCDRPGS
jgi:hypothetical protein